MNGPLRKKWADIKQLPVICYKQQDLGQNIIKDDF